MQRQVYFKLTQLIGGTFPRHFFKKSKQRSKQWHTTRKRTSQNTGCKKKKFKIVWEKFQHRAESICSKLDSTLDTIFVLTYLLRYNFKKIHLDFYFQTFPVHISYDNLYIFLAKYLLNLIKIYIHLQQILLPQKLSRKHRSISKLS